MQCCLLRLSSFLVPCTISYQSVINQIDSEPCNHNLASESRFIISGNSSRITPCSQKFGGALNVAIDAPLMTDACLLKRVLIAMLKKVTR